MAGLLDFSQYDDPEQAARLAFAASLLESGGPQRFPSSVGQGIGRAVMMGRNTAQLAGEAKRRNQLVEAQMQQQLLQMQEMRRQQAEHEAALDLMQKYSTPQYPLGSTMMTEAGLAKQASVPQGPDFNAMRLAALQSRNLTGVKLAGELAGPAPKPVMVPEGTRVLDPNSWKELASNPKPQDPNKPFIMVDGKQVPNPAYQQYELQKAAAGAARQSVSVNTMTPFKTELQKDMAKNLAANQEKYATAGPQIENLQKAKALISQSAPFVGSLAEKKLAAVKFLNNNLGLGINPEAVAASGELQTRLFSQVMENLKKMDAQPSQYQQVIMMEAFGQLGSDPNALVRILDAVEEGLRKKVEGHNERVKQFESQPDVGKLPYDLTIKLPPPAGGDWTYVGPAPK